MNHNRVQAGTELKRSVYLAVAYLMLAMSGLVVWGQPRSNGIPVSNRYLFLVETSRSMQARSEGTINALESLLTSGMQGQMHSNDTIGVWTFNQKLSAGKFPLQQWTGSNQKTLSAAVTAFLNQQKYEKSPDFAQVFPTLEEVAKNSDFLTIVLFSSGESLIHGTAFDDKINKYFKDWLKVQQKAHMPFVTVLRAEKGVINDYSMNSAPWPVHLSPLPAELVAAFEAEDKPAPPPPPPQPKAAATAAPLYFSGRKSSPSPAPAGALYFSGPATNDVPAPIPSTPAPVAPQSGPAMDSGQGSQQPNLRGTALVESSPSGTSPSVSPESHPVLAQAPPPQTQGVAQPESPAAMRARPLAERSQSLLGTDPASPAITQAPLAAKPQPQPKPENLSSTAASAPVAVDTGARASSKTATAVPAVRGFGGALIWIVPLGVALIGGCVFLLRRNKSQPSAQGSFITRSYDKNEPKS